MSLPWPDPNSISTFDMIQILRAVVRDKIPTLYGGRLHLFAQDRGKNRGDGASFFKAFDDLIFAYDWENRKSGDLPISWDSTPDFSGNLHSFWLKPNWSISDIGFLKTENGYTIAQTSPAYVKFSDLETMLGEPLVPSPTRCDKCLWLKWLRQRLKIIDYLQQAVSDSYYFSGTNADGAYRWSKTEDNPPQKINDSYAGRGRTAYALWNDTIWTYFYQHFYVAGTRLYGLEAIIRNGGYSIHGKLKLEQWGLVKKYDDDVYAWDEFFYDFGLDLQEDTFVRLGTVEATADPATHVMIRELTEPKEWRTPYEGMSRRQACGFTAGEVLELSVYDFTENATYYGGL